MTATLEEMLPLIRIAANNTHPRYRAYVDRDDIVQELTLYALGPGLKRLSKMVEQGAEPYAVKALCSAGRLFCEREKAAKCGYEFEDVAWYTPDRLAGVVDVALDESWDGLTGEQEDDAGLHGRSDPAEGNTLLAMVVDVRRALKACPEAARVLTSGGVGSLVLEEERLGALGVLAEWLGGERPVAPGMPRRAVA